MTLLRTFSLFVVAGCGAILLSSCTGSSTPNNVVINGTVSSGGSAPAVAIGGATVSIYQAQTGTPILVVQTTTDGAGNFTAKVPVSNTNTNSNPALYYAVATKSSGIQLIASLGSGPLSAVKINDLTTVATAYAFAQFLQSDLSIAGSAIPLSIAAGMAENLVAAESGSASIVIQTSPNGYETNTWSALGSLANKLAACTQGLSNACTALFAATPASNAALPTNTMQAAVNIALNPANNVTGIFNLVNATNAYSPALTANQGPSGLNFQKLQAWTMALKVNNSGNSNCPFGGPANVAFDVNGYAWINNNVLQPTANSSNCLMVLQPNGKPATGLLNTPNSPITGGGILGSGFGIAIDTLGNIWSGNFGWGNSFPSSGSVTKLSSLGVPVSPSTGYTNGLSRVQGIAVDQSNNIWMASYGNNSVVVYRNGSASNAASYTDSNTEPFGVAIASDGSAWVSYTGSDTVSKLKITNGTISKLASVILPAGSNPKGVAVDSLGNAWVAAGANSTVYEINSSGTIIGTYTGQGINGPWGISIDAKGNPWVANFGDVALPLDQVPYSVVQLCGATGNCPVGVSTGTAISPATGYTLPSAGSQVLLNSGVPLYGTGSLPSYRPLMRLTSVNADMAGNIWAANNWKPSAVSDLSNPGGDGMVIFIGVAAPTKAPTLGPAQSP
ncbi:NHL repeat-containing protein [Polynucleobacter sp. AM-25C3]|uniref:NHL repeat-containing protein n=1 Tax=Polynucleobacter sp. AM-25C3 TaxID=1855569 RepID=UPI001C0BA0DD|nr:NHL repeat-containing protein [Polynucleobacter sp. AM-25C3]MBU3601744.1 NHL repeat-containing protein [Polynucleobacter sp. AM-25C3]